MTLTVLCSLIYGAALSPGGDGDAARERAVENLNPRMAERETGGGGGSVCLIKYISWAGTLCDGIRPTARPLLAFLNEGWNLVPT